MGISATLAAFKNAWYTITSDGYAPYRTENGSPINPIKMAEYANQTSKQYDISMSTVNPYIEPDRPTLAYA